MTSADPTSQAFPWLTARQIEVAGVAVRALRVNFVGELHHPLADRLPIYEAFTEAGAEHGLAPFGMRA